MRPNVIKEFSLKVYLGRGVLSRITYHKSLSDFIHVSVIIGNGVTSIERQAFERCTALTSVYYEGTQAEWANISIRECNDNLIIATRYYYSESQPTESGNYWHYDESGNIAVW